MHISEEPLACNRSQGHNLMGSSASSIPAAREWDRVFQDRKVWPRQVLHKDRHQYMQLSC